MRELTSRQMGQWLIEARGLTKVYLMGKAEVHALRGVDLHVSRGEFVALMGPSGSGKSTLMHLLGCLDSPTAGAYRLEGRDVSELSGDERARVRNSRVGFVFQTFNLLARESALDNVELPMIYRDMPDKERREISQQMLEIVGLAHRSKHRPAEMSGGERQRVAIARSLVNSPSIILADEPTGNLDSRTGAEIMSIFEKLNADGITIILVTHEKDIAMYSQRIIHLRDGLVEGEEKV